MGERPAEDDLEQPQSPRDGATDGRPKIRPVGPLWIEHEGAEYVYLRDPLGLTGKGVMVPRQMAPLLALCDGTRDFGELQAGLALRTGMRISTTQVAEFVAGLDEALLLEGGAYVDASARALKNYRDAPYREPSHADLVYPADPAGLASELDRLVANVEPFNGPRPANGALVGMVCPHIDYQRGGGTYAQLFARCQGELEEIELAVVLGTDHHGGNGMLTPTRQSYATPFGVLPTDLEIVEGLANVLGEERAFTEELHHKGEHSVELAAVWLHHFLGGRPCSIVPVLCGSFQKFTSGGADVDEDGPITAAVDFLQEAIAGRRTLVIAAADLAHVGPAFGDGDRLDSVGRARLAADDAGSIDAIKDGDAAGFLALSQADGDARRICGLPPIYLALRLLGEVAGESIGYDQCPADADAGSLVSIVGALLYEK